MNKTPHSPLHPSVSDEKDSNNSPPSKDTLLKAPTFDGQVILPSQVVLDGLRGDKVAAVFASQPTTQSDYSAVNYISITRDLYSDLQSLMKKYPGQVEYIRALSFSYPQTSAMQEVAQRWERMVLQEGGKLRLLEEEKSQVVREEVPPNAANYENAGLQQSSLSLPPPPRLVWFVLLDCATGESYKGTSTSSVLIPPDFFVAQFRKQIYQDNASILKGITSSQLIIYKNKDAFDKRNVPNDPIGKSLEEDSFLHGLGETEEDAIIAVVPSLACTSRNISEESSITGKQPHPKRKQRWIEINRILEGSNKKSKSDNSAINESANQQISESIDTTVTQTHPYRLLRWEEFNAMFPTNPIEQMSNDSMDYSYGVTWNQLTSIFQVRTYVQPRQSIDDVELDFIAKYLSYATKCLSPICTGSDNKRLYFIAPIAISICNLLGKDVEMFVEEDLVGRVFKARARFEFMLIRGNKAICFVLARKDDLEKGMIQYLVGSEVAAEVFGLDTIYGVVTNYVQWTFLRCEDDKVEVDPSSIQLTPDGPSRESLKEISEKIYAMLF